MEGIHVTSEIGKLKKVLLHRPGKELLNLTPDSLGELLFDDIPFLPDAQKEHDAFAQALKDNGVEVVYLEDLVAEVLSLSEEIKLKFIRQFMKEAGITTIKYKNLVEEYLRRNLSVNGAVICISKNEYEVKSLLRSYTNPIVVLQGHYHCVRARQTSNIVYVTSPSLVTFPNGFRVININSNKKRTLVDVFLKETNLKETQTRAKLRVLGTETLYGAEDDRNITFEIKKSKE